ncbi:unnamed protein product [Effrenium voratum]|nr:unnamed protein product [Effrenium voratum]
MINAIRLGNGWKERKQEERDLLLIDLRPKMSAWANKAGGGGFESYPNTGIIFGGIDNIHVVRDAWRAMGAAVTRIHENQAGSWMKDVANSGWYDYIGAILACTLKAVTEIVTFKCNVMIHCSDGWDRTAQVSSLAMLCMDPYYRTQAGFLKLVQKEWCSFGHRFRTRLALGDAPTTEYSPVIVQWLECVFQLLQQFPDAFEFTDDALLRLAEEVFTNRYGTFFQDNELERSHVVAGTLSLWSALLEDSQTWQNAGYKAEQMRIFPSVCQATYGIWEAYWFRFHARGARLKPAPLPPSERTAPSPSSLAPSPEVTEDPFAPDFLEGPSDHAEPSLFSPAELIPKAKAAPPPPPLFGDDDEDVFAKHTKRGDKSLTEEAT